MAETPRHLSREVTDDDPRNPLLDNPEISFLRDLILATEFHSDNEYHQALLTLVHVCDLAYQDADAQHANDTIVAVAFMLADIHKESGRYGYCLGELDFIFRDYSHHGDANRAKMRRIFEDIFEEVDTIPDIVFCPVSAKILTQ